MFLAFFDWFPIFGMNSHGLNIVVTNICDSIGDWLIVCIQGRWGLLINLFNFHDYTTSGPHGCVIINSLDAKEYISYELYQQRWTLLAYVRAFINFFQNLVLRCGKTLFTRKDSRKYIVLGERVVGMCKWHCIKK